MALLHGIAYLARNVASTRAYWFAVASVASVTVCAFAQSFGALKAFALESGVLAPGLTPIIVDATIGVSTFALVVLNDAHASVVHPAHPATSPDGAAGTATPHRETASPLRETRREPAPAIELRTRALSQTHPRLTRRKRDPRCLMPRSARSQ